MNKVCVWVGVCGCGCVCVCVWVGVCVFGEGAVTEEVCKDTRVETHVLSPLL